MGDYLKCYEVTIKALAPIHVGSGEKIGKKEYIYLPWNHKVIIPDIQKMYKALQRKGQAKEFEDYMMSSASKEPALGQWLGKLGYKATDYEQWKRYDMDAGEAFLSKTARPKEINVFVKDSYGMPYVPGSSVKGMIRSALLAWEVQKNPKRYQSMRRTIEGKQFRNERERRDKCLSKEIKELEQTTFYTLMRDQKKSGNAVNDNLSGLHVGDSSPIPVEALTLCQKIDYTVEGNQRALPLLRESLIPGTIIRFPLTIDTTLCPYSMEEILESLECFRKISDQYFYSRFHRGSQKENTVWLGGGCGFCRRRLYIL